MDNLNVVNDDLVIARKYLLNGEYEQGIRYCKNIKKNFGNNTDFWIVLGDLYNNNDQYKKAIKSYEIAYLLSPNKSIILIRLTVPYMKIGNYNKTGIYWARAVSLGEGSEEIGQRFADITNNPKCEPWAMLEICKIFENFLKKSEKNKRKMLKFIGTIKKLIVYKIIQYIEKDSNLTQFVKYTNILENLGIRKVLKEIENMKKNIYGKKPKNSEDQYLFMNLSFSEKNKFSPERLKNLLMIGTIMFKKQNFEDAYYYCVEAIEVADILKDSKNKLAILKIKAKLLNILGGRDISNGYYYDAYIKYDEALKLSLELQIQESVATSLKNLGVISLIKREYDQALEKCNKALEIVEKSPNPSNKAIYINTIGKIYYELGNYNKALEKFQNANEIAKSQNNQLAIALSLHNIGKLFYKQGDNIRALDLLNDALHILNEHYLESSYAIQIFKKKIETLKSKMI